MIRQKIATGQKLWSLWHVDEVTRRFIAHNEKLWNPNKYRGSSAEILCNLDPVCLTHVKFSYLLNVLAAQHQAAIKTFSTRPAITQRRLCAVYQSFNIQDYITVPAFDAGDPKIKKIVAVLWPQVTSPPALFDIKIEGIWIGIDIYETYLRKYEQPTINLADSRLQQLFTETVGLVLFWRDYFATHDVHAVGISIDGYTANNTVTKVAQAAGVPVYTPDLLAPRIRDAPFAASAVFPHYRELFSKLPAGEQADGLRKAEQQLKRRLGGEVGVNMSYSSKSAWHREFSGTRVLLDNFRTKVLICSHDLVDAPHSHGGMLFVDFVEWLLFVAKIAHETDYDWYIKLHADHDPASAEVVKEITAAFPKLTVVPASTSHHQLVAEGISVVLTCYGSVGHEYPLLNIPVLNAGYNPQIAYSFNYHARSKEEYRDYLLRLPTFRINVNPLDVYEFYYMHYYDELARSDIAWWQEFVARHGSEVKAEPGIYDWWLTTINAERHQALLERLQRAVPRRVHHVAELASDNARSV